MKDYVVLDLETTGLSREWSDIIEIGALRVRDNNIVAEYDQLINPGYEIDEFITELTGITNEMLSDKPSIETVLNEILDFLGNDIILGHNVHFDLGFLKTACEKQSITFDKQKVDTMYIARKALPELKHHRLKDLCSYFNIVNDNAHRAVSDCKATYEIYVKLLEYNIPEKPIVYGKKKEAFKHSYETDALNELLKLLKDIVSDDIVTAEEADTINDWLNKNDTLCDRYPFDIARSALDQIIESETYDNKGLSEIKNVFKELSDPHFYNEANDSIDLNGKLVCLSGEFEYGTKAEVNNLLESKGAIMQANITSKTDYLIVGSEGNVNWSAGKYGSKIKKALDLQNKGNEIKIYGERDLFSML